MGIKVLAVGAAAAVLLAPGAAVLGVATLISPAAAGSGSCMWDGQATESLGVSGPVPDEPQRDKHQRRDRHPQPAAAHPRRDDHRHRREREHPGPRPDDRDHDRPDRVVAACPVEHRRLPRLRQHPERRRRQRPRLRRPLPATPRRGMGQRREPDGPRLVIPSLLRRSHRPEPRLAAWPARHRRLGIDGSRRRGPGRPGLGLSRPLRRQPADRGEGPHRR